MFPNSLSLMVYTYLTVHVFDETAQHFNLLFTGNKGMGRCLSKYDWKMTSALSTHASDTNADYRASDPGLPVVMWGPYEEPVTLHQNCQGKARWHIHFAFRKNGPFDRVVGERVRDGELCIFSFCMEASEAEMKARIMPLVFNGQWGVAEEYRDGYMRSAAAKNFMEGCQVMLPCPFCRGNGRHLWTNSFASILRTNVNERCKWCDGKGLRLPRKGSEYHRLQRWSTKLTLWTHGDAYSSRSMAEVLGMIKQDAPFAVASNTSLWEEHMLRTHLMGLGLPRSDAQYWLHDYNKSMEPHPIAKVRSESW